MGRTSNGYAPMSEEFHRLLSDIPQLNDIETLRWDMIEMNPILDSSNVTVNEWNKIGDIISENYFEYQGFLVLHGTDTMAYTAAALSFMLEGLDKPVIITGSQIPLCEPGNDAKDNIIAALKIASDDIIREVCICFGGKVIRGNRAVKVSADDFVAFSSPNCEYLAEVGEDVSYNLSVLRKNKDSEFSFCRLKNTSIAVVKVFPGMQSEIFGSMMPEGLQGLVIEAFGAGNIPALSMIDKAADNGTVIAVCTQCQHGTVSLGTYEASSQLKRAGAVSGYDMTTEAAFTKLYYLFSKGYHKDKIRIEMGNNLRGELNGR